MTSGGFAKFINSFVSTPIGLRHSVFIFWAREGGFSVGVSELFVTLLRRYKALHGCGSPKQGPVGLKDSGFVPGIILKFINSIVSSPIGPRHSVLFLNFAS